MPYSIKVSEKFCTDFHFSVSELVVISVFDFLARGAGVS